MTTTQQAYDIFGRWITWQRVYQRRDIVAFMDKANQAYWEHLVLECSKNATLRKSIGYLFEVQQNGGAIKNGRLMLHNLLTFIESDINAFLNYVKTHHLFDDAPKQPLSEEAIATLLEDNTALMKNLFYDEDEFSQSEYLFSIGNRFFEYCFVNSTHKDFFALLHREADYPLARLIQIILWQFLCANGWRDWHADCLAFLKQQSDAGKTITYIAGGLDVYQLLKNGIYNIEIVDPLLPSQAAAEFYVEEWSWLIAADHIGDEIIFTDNVVLRRHNHEVFDTFQAVTASGETVDITHTHTTWRVCDPQSPQPLGTVTFKRRFVTQSDFANDPSTLVLVSFNEMYMLSAPSYCGGWGIDAERLADNMKIAVKQFPQPINATSFKNMTRSNEVPFRFINLGGCVT